MRILTENLRWQIWKKNIQKEKEKIVIYQLVNVDPYIKRKNTKSVSFEIRFLWYKERNPYRHSHLQSTDASFQSKLSTANHVHDSFESNKKQTNQNMKLRSTHSDAINFAFVREEKIINKKQQKKLFF